MPFVSQRPKLRLTGEETSWLRQLSQSRSEAAGQVQRAEILLRYRDGETVSGIAAALRTNRPRVERCIAKALELGARGALQDLPGERPASDLDRGSAGLGRGLGLPKTQDLGLRSGVVDDRAVGPTRAQTGCGRRACEFAALGTRNRFQDSARAACATAQDRVLSGATR